MTPIQALEWALENVRFRIDTAAGLGCAFCDGEVLKIDYRGKIDDKITHINNCPYVKAHKALDKMKMVES